MRAQLRPIVVVVPVAAMCALMLALLTFRIVHLATYKQPEPLPPVGLTTCGDGFVSQLSTDSTWDCEPVGVINSMGYADGTALYRAPLEVQDGDQTTTSTVTSSGDLRVEGRLFVRGIEVTPR